MPSPAKSRGRKLVWVALVVFAMGALGLVLFLQRPRSGVEARLANLRAQGMPTGLEDLERSLGTSAEEGRRNAKQLILLREKIRIDAARPLPKRGTLASPEDQAWAKTQLGGDNETGFRELRDQLHAGPWCFVSYAGGAMNPSIDHLAEVKGLANALEVEAVCAALVGDAPRAVQALSAGLQVGRTVESGGVLIDYLVRTACDTIAARSAESVLSRMQFSEGTLAELQDAFRAAEGTNVLARALIGERAFGISSFQMTPAQLTAAVNAGTGTGPSPGPPPTVRGGAGYRLYRTFLLQPDLGSYLDEMELLIQAVRLSGPEARRAVQKQENQLRAARVNWRRIQTTMLLPSLLRATAKEWRRIATMRCAQTGCAVERFRAKNGRLPASLNELVPVLLESIPLDPMSGEALKYRRLEPGFVVYSVGENDLDDGGMEFNRRPKKSPDNWDYTFVVER